MDKRISICFFSSENCGQCGPGSIALSAIYLLVGKKTAYFPQAFSKGTPRLELSAGRFEVYHT